MKKKRERRIAMLLAIMMLVMNLIVSPVWAEPGVVAINGLTFPDPNFREYVKTNFNTNGDDALSQDELDAVKKINVENKGITDLKGVEYFTGLKELNCRNNRLTALDLKYNTKLISLLCSSNELTTLNLSENKNLITLYCNDNKLTDLDLSKNTGLGALYCNNNQLTNLALTNTTNLTTIQCSNNQLTNLALTNTTSLKFLDCQQNQLTNLALTNTTSLITLDCQQNQLTNLALTNTTNLTTIQCSNNQLTTLNLKNTTNLKTLYCYQNQLTTLDLTNNTKLETLHCYQNQLKTLNLSKNINLKDLGCGQNQLTALDLSENKNLKTLYCERNQLTTLDLTNNTELGYLSCMYNQLITLGLSKNINLKDLYCGQNQLTTLDLSNNAKLTTIDCQVNQLSALDLSNKINLEALNCNQNKLTTLDLSNNAKLTRISCAHNQLAALDLTNNTNIEYFYISNQERSVTVSGSSRSLDLTELAAGFAPSKMSELVGGKVSGNTLTLDADKPGVVTYKYEASTGKKLEVRLIITYVEAVVESIKVISADHKTEYKVGDPLDVSNLKIEATMSDGSTKTVPVTSDMVGGFDTSTAGTKTLTITYEGKTTTYNINVTPVTYTLTASVDGGHGTVSPTTKTVNKDETVTLTFAPEANYEIEEVKVNGTATTVSGNSLVITMNEDKTVVVKYKEKAPEPPTQYTLTASVDGGHGTVSPTTKTVNKDETVTLTFAPEANYEIEEVKVNGTATTVSGNSLVITMNEDKTVVVKYKEKAPEPPTPEEKVTITFDANGGTGTMADVTKTKGESFTLPACTFTPPAGKEFKAWQVDGTEKNVGDNIEVNGDINIKAVWKDIGSVPPTPPVPPTPDKPITPTPEPYPNPWIVYPGWYYNFEAPKPKEEKPVTKMEMDWKIEFAIGTSTIDREINGVDSKIKMDVAPYIRDGRIMLPLRSLAEALGFEVEWNRSTRTVVLKDNNTRVEIPVGTNKIIVNGNVYTSDVKPEIKNNRTMLPIANLARALGLSDGKDIIWNSKSKMVTIYRSIVVK